ncbi:hypothetical protein HYU95_05885 [Candidatus Daviesbacteria bacterium]|nr:hypothetical protein [Candidatus Daviesbacteria bacterium]
MAMAAVERNAEIGSAQGQNLIPSPRPYKTYVIEGIVYELFKIRADNEEALRRRFFPFELDFAYGEGRAFTVPYSKTIHNIQRGNKVLFARTLGPDAQDVGTLAYQVRKPHLIKEKKLKKRKRLKRIQKDISQETQGKIEKSIIIDAGLRDVHKDWRKLGIGATMARVVLAEEMPHIWIGLTRAWGLQRANEKIELFEQSYPFGLPLNEGEESTRGAKSFPLEFQELLIAVLPDSVFNKIDLKTGVCKKVLPPKKSDFFVPPTDNPRALEIDRIMRVELGATPEAGDAIQTLHVVDRKALQALIDSGFGIGNEQSALSIQPPGPNVGVARGGLSDWLKWLSQRPR